MLDLLILIVGLLAIASFFHGVQRKAVIYLLLSAGLFFILGVILHFDSLQVSSGSTIACTDINATDTSCAIIQSFNAYTSANNVIVLTFGYLSWFFCIMSFVYIVGLMGVGKSKGD